jgi:uncharacterized membrane protein (UPF0182 family)
MRNWKRLLTITTAVLVGLVVLVIALGIALTNFLVDFWWFSSLDYAGYFWLRFLYRYIISGGVTIFFFLIFFLNFWAASRYLGVDQDEFSSLVRTEPGKHYQRVLHMFQVGSLQVYTPLSLVLAIIIALPFYQQWEEALLFLFGPDSDVMDPVYHWNVGFYLFRLPMFDLIQSELLITFALLVLAIALLYWMEHQLIPVEKKKWALGAKIHLNTLILLTALIAAWGFVLDRYDLLYTAVHQPVFFGPGFVELRYVLPLIWLSGLALVAGTLCGMTYVQKGANLKPLIGFLVLFLLAWGLRQSDFLPKVLDRFVVKPNPVRVEGQFMKNNIEATLAAYDLDHVKTINMTAAWGPRLIDPRMREQLHNIPIWDPEYLDEVYQQLQGIRPYYQFTDVDTARYEIGGEIEQVNLAPRELNIAKLPAAAQNWENTHLRYTHGYGAVITPASQSGEQPMEWFLRDLDLRSDVGFRIEKPDVYFGMEKLDYAVVPNRLNIVDIASFDVNSSQNYTGKDGLPVSSLLRRLLYAIYLRDEKLFFSINIDERSKVLIRRNIVERIKTLTPYLSLDHDPYIVVTPQRILWVQDAYTTSNWYPVSQSSNFAFGNDYGERKFNYIRNSVKIVVDAFDGTVDYYVADPKDPIIQGYKKAYPGIFKDLNTLPPRLREQLRYPKDMFTLQMAIYARYHQTDPALFYQQAETWDFAKVNDQVVKPYYITTYIERAEELKSFILLNPMTPIGRQNLSMLGIAGSLKSAISGVPFSKQIVVYQFSKEVQVNGASQVSALIDQDPEIARLFALWDQKGSHVQRGRIIILPIGHSLLYVQPIYLVSTGATRIPELARIILAMDNFVVMETSLERALDKLEARVAEAGVQEARPAPSVPPVPEKEPAMPIMSPQP